MLVTTAPYDGERVMNAQKFALALIQASDIELLNIFFYQQGVLNANSLSNPPAQEINLYSGWCEIACRSNASLQVCVTAAAKRGIISQQEMNDHGLSGFSLASPFEQTGLAEFFTQLHKADRLVQF